MSYYVIRDKYAVPGFLFSALGPWMIALTLILAAIPGASHSDLLAGLPWPISALLFACYGYAMIGSFCIYMAMWIYWAAVERSSIVVRIGWFLALTCGLILGSFIYALVVWKKNTRKVNGPQPVS
jgi:hypothetical protein